VAARRPRLLEVVARHADVWEVNLPPSPARVREAAGALEAACLAAGRDPGTLGRSMLFFTRLARSADPAPFLGEFRRLNPWFASVPDEELLAALVVGSPEQCRERLASLAEACAIDHPYLDLSGVPAGEARRLLEALAPGDRRVDTGDSAS
jgi:alkanesulfonate monooxygenase SsuD/methylene tetrahydromethanopterin reductase-like flavin-dependent oxidoreductase (luciferase family)